MAKVRVAQVRVAQVRTPHCPVSPFGTLPSGIHNRVIAMAGDDIEISDGAMMMIHDPWTMAKQVRIYLGHAWCHPFSRCIRIVMLLPPSGGPRLIYFSHRKKSLRAKCGGY
jgi:hypothetical protein